MSHTLLLRLAAPLQSWGLVSHAEHKDTASHPTKSGVIGLLAAASGHERHEPLGRLLQLRFGVRADRPGSLYRDYHTVGAGRYPLRPRDVILDSDRADRAAPALEHATGPTFTSDAGDALRDWYGAPKRITQEKATGVLTAPTERTALLTTRWYLADAAFLAAVEHPDPDYLHELAAHLDKPQRLLWLGRKSCPPAAEIPHGVHDGEIQDVLARTASLPNATEAHPWTYLEMPSGTPGAIRVPDQPISFHPDHRARADRLELRTRITPTTPSIIWDDEPLWEDQP